MSNQPATPDRTKSGLPWKKLALVAVVAVAAFLAYTQFGHNLTLASLAQRESELRTFQEQHPVLVYGAAFLLYVAVTGLSLPGAAVLTLTYGWYFGLVRGILVVSFASTAGATLAFLFSRFLFRDMIKRRFGDRLEQIDRALKREGPFYLFTLRLIPAVPFFVINAVMGLTPIPARTFWWVSQLGMLPGTAVYVYAGASVPDLSTLADKGAGGILSPQLIIAFVLLGIFPLIIKKVAQRFRPANTSDEEAVSSVAHDSTSESAKLPRA